MVSQANASLVLVLVIVAAAHVGGRWAGGWTALAAAVSFDFFLTKPYGSLAIKSAQDVWTTALLFVIGIVVGRLVDARRRAKVRSRSVASELDSVFDVAALSASGAPVEDVIRVVEHEIAAALHLASCRVDLVPERPPLPVLPADGRALAPYVHDGEGFALPTDGVAIAIASVGTCFGWVLCFPAPGLRGVSRERRRTAIVLAEQLAMVLARRGAEAA